MLINFINPINRSTKINPINPSTNQPDQPINQNQPIINNKIN